jgi:UDP-N-acetylmuramoylalanine--D-glutamate ligase
MMKLVVLGAGESGLGAAMLARQKGYAVFVSDAGKISLSRKNELEKEGISFEEGKHSEGKILGADLIVKSPGISPLTELVAKASIAQIPMIDELEFAFGFSTGKVIAITGTNGKTTTSLLTYHLMKEAGLDVGLAGNVGKSWAAQLTYTDHEWWVIECSSFQIDGMVDFKPYIAMLCNITPDHLDRYDYTIEHYINSKFGLFQKMDSGDHAILFAEDERSHKGLKSNPVKADQLWISAVELQANGAWTDGHSLNYCIAGKTVRVPIETLSIKGKHNWLNSLFAGSAALLAGVSDVELMLGFPTFKNAPHRMETVRELDGVTYINDSKGTNVEATAYALASFESPLIWIAGGVDKGNDYSVLVPLIADKVKCLICLGKDNTKLKQAFASEVEKLRETEDISEAINWAKELSAKGDVVLLSPACASFDLFNNYEDRGQQFIAAVNQLISKTI